MIGTALCTIVVLAPQGAKGKLDPAGKEDGNGGTTLRSEGLEESTGVTLTTSLPVNFSQQDQDDVPLQQDLADAKDCASCTAM